MKVVACSISPEESEEQKREDHRNLQHFLDISNYDMANTNREEACHRGREQKDFREMSM